jgi:hypothetical protein
MPFLPANLLSHSNPFLIGIMGGWRQFLDVLLAFMDVLT